MRRRVFVVVALLTVAFLALYGLGVVADLARRSTRSAAALHGVEGEIVAGATLLGLSMFATLFLGAILAVFLTLGAVRGDAERGLLQPLLVRPLGARDVPGRALRGRRGRVRGLRDRSSSSPRSVITNVFIDWWPDRIVVPALELARGGGGDRRARARPARSCSRAPRTGSRSSCSSAPG